MTRAITSDTSEGPSTCADLVATLKAPKTPSSRPTLEGETTIETFIPTWRRWRAIGTAAPTNLHPTFLITWSGSSREADTGLRGSLLNMAHIVAGSRAGNNTIGAVVAFDGPHLRTNRAARGSRRQQQGPKARYHHSRVGPKLSIRQGSRGGGQRGHGGRTVKLRVPSTFLLGTGVDDGVKGAGEAFRHLKVVHPELGAELGDGRGAAAEVAVDDAAVGLQSRADLGDEGQMGVAPEPLARRAGRACARARRRRWLA